MSSPFLWVYEDSERGLALIRGHAKPVLEMADLLGVARYSVTGKGWVIPLDAVANFACMCDYSNTPYRYKRVEQAS